MYSLKYDNFYQLFQNNLKEILYPIKKYFKKKKIVNKKSYAFFPKHSILLEYMQDTAIISNFKNDFFFEINYQDIKQVKLYKDENKYDIFWTCGFDFTKYYFTNYLNKRICIKSEGSFKSIDLDNNENLKYNSYYLFPSKEFNYKKIIKSLLHIDWNNPPQEIDYIIQKGKYYDKYKFQNFDLKNEKTKTFFHNAQIGITLSIIRSFYIYYNNKCRIFYFNCNYIFNSIPYNRKKYFLYFLNLLFFEKESQESNNFLMKIYYDFNKYNNKYEQLFTDIINHFENDQNILIIFDNIHSKDEYELVKNIIEKANLLKKNVFIREIIEINENTLNILKYFLEKNKMIEMIGNWKNKKLKDDLNIIVELMDKKEKSLSNYKQKINQKLSELFKKYSINKYISLIKLFYYLYTNELSKHESKELILLDELRDFIDFLYLTISNGQLIKIEFRNKIIEYFFNNYYIYYHDIFFNEQSKKFLKELLESEKGYNFERQIIFSIIIGNFSKFYKRVNVNRIYCVEKFEKFNLDKNINILFYQIIPNGPFYDFAILIRNKKGEFILKVFQVSISKKKEDLEKLEIDKIEFDISYFIEKLCRILNIKIKVFTFGIITSYQIFQKQNLNAQVISDFCFKNKYELLLYDIDLNNFYINRFFINKSKGIRENSLKKIESFEEINNSYTFKSLNIFKSDGKISKKFYIEKINPSPYVKLINKAFSLIPIESKKNNEINEKIKLNPILVGKFDSDISVFEQNKNDNLIFYYHLEANKKEAKYIYYHELQLYSIKSEGFDSRDNNLKNEIFVFKIEISAIKNLDFSKYKKISLKLCEKDKESNINYLLYDKVDEINSFFEDEENAINESEKSEENEENEDESVMTLTLEQMNLINENNLKNEIEEYEFKKDFNDYNYAVIYDKLKQTNSLGFENEQNDENKNNNSDISKGDFSISQENQSNEEKESNEKEINFNSYEFKGYPICEYIYKQLLKGNKTVYNIVMNNIEMKKANNDNNNQNNDFNETDLLKKKRNNTFPSKKEEKKPELLRKDSV